MSLKAQLVIVVTTVILVKWASEDVEAMQTMQRSRRSNISEVAVEDNAKLTEEVDVKSLEQDDMLSTHVTPHDYEDSSKQENATLPPLIFPEDDNVKSYANANSSLKEQLNRTLYLTSTEIEEATERVVAKLKTKETIEREVDNDVSSGLVALFASITFAVTVVVIYLSLMFWRRYWEYKYGTRELLVNELEFDTNDLRHFEL